MAVTAAKLIEPIFLSNGLTTLYTVPEATQTIIKKATLVNTDAAAQTASLYLVPANSSAQSSNTILKDYSLAAAESYDVFPMEGHTLNAGDSIQGLASVVDAVNIQVSGVEIA